MSACGRLARGYLNGLLIAVKVPPVGPELGLSSLAPYEAFKKPKPGGLKALIEPLSYARDERALVERRESRNKTAEKTAEKCLGAKPFHDL
jgi:hypothetical protein